MKAFVEATSSAHYVLLWRLRDCVCFAVLVDCIGEVGMSLLGMVVASSTHVY